MLRRSEIQKKCQCKERERERERHESYRDRFLVDDVTRLLIKSQR